MGLEEEYPKHFRKQLSRWRSLLAKVSDLSTEERDALAAALDDLANKVLDLNEILHRLTEEEHSCSELGELLIAAELTLEQLRGVSDDLDGNLYEVGDRLKTPKQKTMPIPKTPPGVVSKARVRQGKAV